MKTRFSTIPQLRKWFAEPTPSRQPLAAHWRPHIRKPPSQPDQAAAYFPNEPSPAFHGTRAEYSLQLLPFPLVLQKQNWYPDAQKKIEWVHLSELLPRIISVKYNSLYFASREKRVGCPSRLCLFAEYFELELFLSSLERPTIRKIQEQNKVILKTKNIFCSLFFLTWIFRMANGETRRYQWVHARAMKPRIVDWMRTA